MLIRIPAERRRPVRQLANETVSSYSRVDVTNHVVSSTKSLTLIDRISIKSISVNQSSVTGKTQRSALFGYCDVITGCCCVAWICKLSPGGVWPLTMWCNAAFCCIDLIWFVKTYRGLGEGGCRLFDVPCCLQDGVHFTHTFHGCRSHTLTSHLLQSATFITNLWNGTELHDDEVTPFPVRPFGTKLSWFSISAKTTKWSTRLFRLVFSAYCLSRLQQLMGCFIVTNTESLLRPSNDSSFSDSSRVPLHWYSS